MLEIFEGYCFFALNFLVVILISILCSYIGVFILLRRIVFIGVAVGKTAACGIAFAFLATPFFYYLGLTSQSSQHITRLTFAIIFALISMLLFSMKTMGKRINQEGIIGLGYSIAAGVTILFVWKSPLGFEKLRNILSGSVLFVNDLSLYIILISALFLGCLHLLCFRQFLFVSFDSEMAYTLGMNVKLWDFILYISIGIIISFSMYIAGLLLVFSLLIVSPLCAIQIGKNTKEVFFLSVIFSVIASTIGLPIAQFLDFPMGASICVILGILFFLSVISQYKPRTLKSFRFFILLCGIICMIPIGISSYHFIKEKTGKNVGTKNSKIKPKEINSLNKILQAKNDIKKLTSLLHSSKTAIREHVIDVLKKQESKKIISLFEKYIPKENILPLKYKIASFLCNHGSKKGLESLINIMKHSKSIFIRSEAQDLFERITQKNFSYDSMKSYEENKIALQNIQKWWQKKKQHIRWNKKNKIFYMPFDSQKK